MAFTQQEYIEFQKNAIRLITEDSMRSWVSPTTTSTLYNWIKESQTEKELLANINKVMVSNDGYQILYTKMFYNIIANVQYGKEKYFQLLNFQFDKSILASRWAWICASGTMNDQNITHLFFRNEYDERVVKSYMNANNIFDDRLLKKIEGDNINIMYDILNENIDIKDANYVTDGINKYNHLIKLKGTYYVFACKPEINSDDKWAAIVQAKI